MYCAVCIQLVLFTVSNPVYIIFQSRHANKLCFGTFGRYYECLWLLCVQCIHFFNKFQFLFQLSCLLYKTSGKFYSAFGLMSGFVGTLCRHTHLDRRFIPQWIPSLCSSRLLICQAHTGAGTQSCHLTASMMASNCVLRQVVTLVSAACCYSQSLCWYNDVIKLFKP